MCRIHHTQKEQAADVFSGLNFLDNNKSFNDSRMEKESEKVKAEKVAVDGYQVISPDTFLGSRNWGPALKKQTNGGISAAGQLIIWPPNVPKLSN